MNSTRDFTAMQSLPVRGAWLWNRAVYRFLRGVHIIVVTWVLLRFIVSVQMIHIPTGLVYFSLSLFLFVYLTVSFYFFHAVFFHPVRRYVVVTVSSVNYAVRHYCFAATWRGLKMTSAVLLLTLMCVSVLIHKGMTSFYAPFRNIQLTYLWSASRRCKELGFTLSPLARPPPLDADKLSWHITETAYSEPLKSDRAVSSPFISTYTNHEFRARIYPNCSQIVVFSVCSSVLRFVHDRRCD